jgi:hypothetical protein
MIRFKTKTDNTGKNGGEVYHVVATSSLDVIQAHWIKEQVIVGFMIKKTYKTLRGAEKAIKEGESVVWEKPMGLNYK